MLQKILAPFSYLFREQKKLMALMLLMTFVFAILIFPYEDLSDVISELVAKASQNQVFVQFDDLGLGVLPPSLKMTNVALDTPVLPTIKAKRLYLSPNLAGLLAFSPGFSAEIDDVLKGQVDIDLRAGKKINDNIRLQTAVIRLKEIDLKALTSFLQAPVDLEGRLGADLAGNVDPTFTEQPDGSITVTISNFHLPPSTIPTPMGPYTPPNIEISNVVLKGTIKAGNFEISEGTFGQTGEPINGRIKGRIAVRLRMMGPQLVPDFGAYELKVDLSFDRTTESNFKLFLSFLDKFRTVTGSGSRYAFRLAGPNFYMPPNPSALGTW